MQKNTKIKAKEYRDFYEYIKYCIVNLRNKHVRVHSKLILKNTKFI